MCRGAGFGLDRAGCCGLGHDLLRQGVIADLDLVIVRDPGTKAAVREVVNLLVRSVVLDPEFSI